MKGSAHGFTLGSIRDMPIRRKLVVITMATTAAALLLAGVGIIIADSILFRRYIQRDLSTLAQMIADNSTAALAFDDPLAASETLAALKARPHVVAACIFGEDGTLFARYVRPGSANVCVSNGSHDGMQSTEDDLTVTRPVLIKGRPYGRLQLVYDLSELAERRHLYGGLVLAVLLGASVAAYLISSGLRGVIATPISTLAQTAIAVAETRDYGIRAPKLSHDELGVLVDGFNDMLAGIQSRDRELRDALLALEQALKDAQNARDSLETTLVSIGDAVISTDVEGRIVLVNAAARSLLRCAEAELAGTPLQDVFRIVNEFSREPLESPVAKVLREGTVVGLANHTVLIARDGTETPIDDSGAPIRDQSGKIQGTVLVFRDVSIRRRADEAGKLLASIVESSVDAIIGYDLGGIITSWNRGAQSILGYTPEETIGRSTSLLTTPGRGDEMPEILERIRQGEKIDQYHALRRTKNGLEIDVSVTVSPVFDALGRIIGASMIARDITEQVRATERLAQLNADLSRTNERLARSNDDLERFAFIASHDLQEPLRMVTIYSQLLIKAYKGDLDEKATTYVDTIASGTQRMRELLAALLAYAEVGVRPEEPMQPVDLNTVLEKVKQNLRVAIEDSGAIVTAGHLPVLKANEAHFIPLFQNLIGNAIKYRGDKTPRIHISVNEVNNQLVFAASDNGIGIEPEYHAKIFVAFKRLHGMQIPGTGIGLAICQRVLERYGGRIWVESEAGKGATFFFTLPVELLHHWGELNERVQAQAET